MIDHIVWIVPDLDAARLDLERDWGVVPATGGRHSEHGTWNTLVGLGGHSYLEILAPDPSARPDQRSRRGRTIAETIERRVLELLLHANDFDALTATGIPGDEYRVTGVFPGERQGLDGSVVRWRRAEFETKGGVRLPDVIEWSDAHPAAALPVGARVHAVTLRTSHRDDVARALSSLGMADGIEFAWGDDGITVVLETPRGLLTL